MTAAELVHRLADLRAEISGDFTSYQALSGGLEEERELTREERVGLYELYSAMETSVCEALAIASSAAARSRRKARL